MKPAATLGLYAGMLAIVFGAAVGVGNAVGPVGTAGADSVPHSAGSGGGEHSEHSSGEHSSGAGEHSAPAVPDADLAPGGLAVSSDGYTLRLDRTTQIAGTRTSFSFAVTRPDGEPLTEFTRTHDKDLHLIVVRRDLTGYQHLHPTRDAQGRWTVPLTLAEPGPYKVFADFTPAGRDRALTLAADLTAPGVYTPTPLPAPTRSTSVDGYEVALDGTLVAGTSSRLVLTVHRDGRPVTDLQPYLGAYGHLVTLREGDLAYLHVHPDGATVEPGPDIVFSADVPSPATYRLFLDFAHAGAVRTAELTATASSPTEAGTAPAKPRPSATASDSSSPHGH